VAADKVEKYEAQALYRAGMCATKMDNWPEAQKHFDSLLKGFPDFDQKAEARYGLALSYQKQSKLAEARPLAEQVTTETETETAAKARYMVGEIDFQEGKFEDAIEQYLLVAVGYPYPEWQARAWFETGRCQIELDNQEKAREAFQTVVDKHADHALAQEAAKQIQALK